MIIHRVLEHVRKQDWAAVFIDVERTLATEPGAAALTAGTD